MTSPRELTGMCPRCKRECSFLRVKEQWQIEDTHKWIVKDFGFVCTYNCLIPHEGYTYSIFSNTAGRVIVFTPTDLGKLIDNKDRK